MKPDFSKLNKFFSLDDKKKKKTLFDWGQETLLPLESKELEKVCADLVMYFRLHPEKDKCSNLIVPENYWVRGKKEPSHEQVNYSFKEWVMNIIVYKDCDYIVFNKEGKIEVVPDSKATRFVAKDAENKKSNLNKKIKDSNFTLEQKDTIWSGVAVGYLDVAVPEKKVKEPKKTKAKK